MQVFETIIEAINPWTGGTVYLTSDDIINPAECYPFDSELCERTNDLCGGDCTTDFDWMTVYASLTTPEHMGIVLIGS